MNEPKIFFLRVQPLTCYNSDSLHNNSDSLHNLLRFNCRASKVKARKGVKDAKADIDVSDHLFNRLAATTSQ